MEDQEQLKYIIESLVFASDQPVSPRVISNIIEGVTPKQVDQIIAALKSVDFTLIFNETNPQFLIKQIKPDIHVKGGDYSLGEIPELKIIEAIGGETVILKEIRGKSTSNVIKKILKYYDK